MDLRRLTPEVIEGTIGCMHRRIFILSLLIVFFVTGCSNQSTSPGIRTPIPLFEFMSNLDDKYAPTPTPFQPENAGNSPLVTPGNPPGPLSTPTPSGIIDLGLKRPEGQVNILLLGSDWRPGMGSRTDVIMLLSLMPEQGLATLTSFPRDLYVDIPGIGYERINTSQAFGGFELTRETFKYNFDAPIDHYMMTNFAGFVGIVDTLGGISVTATQELYDRCDLPQAINKMCYVPAGRTTMDGQTALWYVRSRYSTSDFDRTRRAQEVIIAILQKTMSLNAVGRAAELYQLFQSSVETDIPLELVVKMLPLAARIIDQPGTLQRFAISEDDITHYTVPATGAMVMIPDNEAIAEIIRQAIYPEKIQN